MMSTLIPSPKCQKKHQWKAHDGSFGPGYEYLFILVIQNDIKEHFLGVDSVVADAKPLLPRPLNSDVWRTVDPLSWYPTGPQPHLSVQRERSASASFLETFNNKKFTWTTNSPKQRKPQMYQTLWVIRTSSLHMHTHEGLEEEAFPLQYHTVAFRLFKITDSRTEVHSKIIRKK